MKVKPGDIIIFRGCSWYEPGWEFDAPCVIYEPVKRYGFNGSISALSVLAIIEEVCIDLCVDGQTRDGWSEGEIKEFKWRGWNPDGFAKRKNACHAEVTVRFYQSSSDELSFDYVAAATVERTGKLTRLLKGIPAIVRMEGNGSGKFSRRSDDDEMGIQDSRGMSHSEIREEVMISDIPTDQEINQVLQSLESNESEICSDAAKCIRWLQHEMNTAYWNQVRAENKKLRAEIGKLKLGTGVIPISEGNLGSWADVPLVAAIDMQSRPAIKDARSDGSITGIAGVDPAVNPDGYYCARQNLSRKE